MTNYKQCFRRGCIQPPGTEMDELCDDCFRDFDRDQSGAGVLLWSSMAAALKVHPCCKTGCVGETSRQGLLLCVPCFDDYSKLPEGTNVPIWLDTPKRQETKRRSISVSLATYQRVKDHTDQSGNSMSSLIEKLIRYHLDSGHCEPDAEERRRQQRGHARVILKAKAKGEGPLRHDLIDLLVEIDGKKAPLYATDVYFNATAGSAPKLIVHLVPDELQLEGTAELLSSLKPYEDDEVVVAPNPKGRQAGFKTE